MKRTRKKQAKKVAVTITIEVVDRYSATGRPRPNPKTVCKGHCEGMGVVPVRRESADAKLAALWKAAERKKPSDDGWHFVTCPDCKGTGKRPGAK